MTIKVYGQNQGIPMGKQAPGSGGGGGGASIDDTNVSKNTSYSSDKVEERLAQKTGAGLSLGFDATLASGVLTFTTTDAEPYTLQENYDYEIDLHFPAAGTLDDTIKMVVENNSETVQFVALTHTNPAESITVGDMKQLMYYDAETGFRWLFKARYKITSTGVKVFVIYPVISKAGDAEIPVATATTLGGIKIGSNVTVEEDGTLSATGKLDLDSIDGGNSQTVYALVSLANVSGDVISQYNGETEGGLYSDIA